MTPIAFLVQIYQHIDAWLFICFALFLIYFTIYRLGISSITDPLFLGIVASSFSASVVIFLAYIGEIDIFYILSFLATEIAFIAATVWGGAKQIHLRRMTPNAFERSWYLTFHYLLVATFLASTSIYLWKVGLPVFQEKSRLITFQELGILTWILDTTWVGLPISILLKRHFLKRKNIIDYPLFCIAFLLFATKGGKSDIVVILFILHIFSQVTGAVSTKKLESTLLVAFPFLIIIITGIVLTTWGVETSALQIVLERFSMFGDVFFMGYNKSFLATVPDIGVIDYFFSGTKSSINSLLGTGTSSQFILGYAISEFYYGSGEGIGPNARHNILGLILWGPIFSVAFSVLCGLAFRICRSSLFTNGKTLFEIFLYIIINIYSWLIFIDPALAVGYLLKLTIVISVLGVLTHLLNPHSLFRKRIISIYNK